jgi:hypothetical protein
MEIDEHNEAISLDAGEIDELASQKRFSMESKSESLFVDYPLYKTFWSIQVSHTSQFISLNSL